MAMPKIDPQWMKLIKAVADNGRIKRGLDYMAEGRVMILEHRHDMIRATVHGSEPEPYRVTVIKVNTDWEAPSHSQFDTRCGCPDQTWSCKHSVAVMGELGRIKAMMSSPYYQGLTSADAEETTEKTSKQLELPEGEMRWQGPRILWHQAFWEMPAEFPEHEARVEEPTHLMTALADGVPNWDASVQFHDMMRVVYEQAAAHAKLLAEDPKLRNP